MMGINSLTISDKLITSIVVAAMVTLSYGGNPDENKLISLKVKDVSLENVLTIISQKSGLNFIPDPAVKDHLITIDLKQIDPVEALSIISEVYGYRYKQLESSGKYLVTPNTTLQEPTQLESYPCEFADAVSLEAVFTQLVTPGAGSVFADPRTNTLIFRDTQSQLQALLPLVEQLDHPTRQIYMQAAIAEVSLDHNVEHGVQWFTRQEKSVAGTDLGLISVLGDLPLTPRYPTGEGLGIGILEERLELVLKALSSISDLNLLSRPHLLTQDNQSAVIEVGDQIPYPQLNEFGVTSYEFKDATIKLNIKSHINNDSTITVYLETQANFQNGETPDGIPIIGKRRVQTQVVVSGGKTIILGGIMRDSELVTQSRVPVLGAIPLIGELFKFDKRNEQKTELVVLLSPHIVDREITAEFLVPEESLLKQVEEK